MSSKQIRADELEVGNIILPGHMRFNKQSLKVIDIEPIANRLFIKVEVLDEDYPTIKPHIDYIPGEILRLDTEKYHTFDIMVN